jgi:hypothetical protein
LADNILMPLDFVLNVEKLILLIDYNNLDDSLKIICNSLGRHLLNKAEALERRNAFSKYKTAVPGSALREVYRRQYLDLAYVHKDWRSDFESPH